MDGARTEGPSQPQRRQTYRERLLAQQPLRTIDPALQAVLKDAIFLAVLDVGCNRCSDNLKTPGCRR